MGQFEKAAVQLGIEAHRHARPSMAGDRWPRSIEREAKFVGNPGDRLPPERELARHWAVGDVLFAQQSACHKV